MPLVLDKTGTLAKLNGIYEEQRGAQKLGLSTDTIRLGGANDLTSPHIVTFKPGPDSINMQAFFDPSVSKKIQGDDVITYIQVGQFRLNGVPLPLSVHETNIPYPTHDQEFRLENFGKVFTRTSWVDIAAIDSNDKDIQFPYYPWWTFSEDAAYKIENFFKNPQSFGSLYSPNSIKKNGEYLCAYMNKFQEINLNRFPSASVLNDFLNEYDIANLVKVGDLPPSFTPSTILQDAEKIVLWLFGYKASPWFGDLNSNIQATELNGKANRLLIRYNSVQYLQGRGVLKETLYILIFPNAAGTGLRCGYMDEDIIEEQLANIRSNGRPDFDKIDELISTECGRLHYFKSDDIVIGYEYITYACQVAPTTPTQTQVSIRLLEGFTWTVSREFENNTWKSPLRYKTSNVNPFGLDEMIFKETLELYFNGLEAQPRTVEWK